jgi:hypothetical protein
MVGGGSVWGSGWAWGEDGKGWRFLSPHVPFSPLSSHTLLPHGQFNAIVTCYLNSAVPPRIHVDLSEEVADGIISKGSPSSLLSLSPSPSPLLPSPLSFLTPVSILSIFAHINIIDCRGSPERAVGVHFPQGGAAHLCHCLPLLSGLLHFPNRSERKSLVTSFGMYFYFSFLPSFWSTYLLRF